MRNYSAGILIFYGAVERSLSDNVDMRLGHYNIRSIPVMGLHRPYYNKEYFSSLSPIEASKAYKRVEKKTKDYLEEMGAPQAIIDRMFNQASNQIDLIEDDEFRKYYKPVEPYFEEWLIAKCSDSVEKYGLTQDESRDFTEIESEQIKTIFKAHVVEKESTSRDVHYPYPIKKYAKSYINKLYKKSRKYNSAVHFCHRHVIKSHQEKWARNYFSK